MCPATVNLFHEALLPLWCQKTSDATPPSESEQAAFLSLGRSKCATHTQMTRLAAGLRHKLGSFVPAQHPMPKYGVYSLHCRMQLHSLSVPRFTAQACCSIQSRAAARSLLAVYLHRANSPFNHSGSHYHMKALRPSGSFAALSSMLV